MPDHVKSLAVTLPVAAAVSARGGPWWLFGEGYAALALGHKSSRCVPSHDALSKEDVLSKELVMRELFKGFPRCGAGRSSANS
jgi:hypothetical protein